MYKFLRGANKFVNLVVFLVALIMLLYSLWSFSDISQVYSNADGEKLLQNENGKVATLAELQNINPDIVGKLTVYDTGVNYPFVQGEENTEYLNKDIYGDNRLSGSIFIDSLNKKDFSDKYTLFYGHRMKSSVMFSDIGEFLNESYFNAHTKGYIETADKKYTIVFFACMRTESSNNLVFDVEVGNRRYVSLLNEIIINSQQYRNIGLNADTRIVGLSTCESADSTGRIILFGKLIENN